MKIAIRQAFHIGSTSLLLWLSCGCAPRPSPPASSLRLISTEPVSPAALHLREKMTVRIQYRVVGRDPVLIFARPYTKGEKTDGYAAHPSYPYTTGKGEAVGWFTCEKPAEVDEVRAQMVDAKTQAVLATASLPIRAVWQ